MPEEKKGHGNLTLWICIAIVGAIALALAFPHQAMTLEVGGELFLRLLKMIVVPLVFTSVLSGILGMGDVVSLVEKAQENLDQDEAARMAEKLAKAEFDFDDFLSQMRQMKKLGSVGSIAQMLPGMGNVNVGDKEDKVLARHEAIILSMTKQERSVPRILGGSRRKRIADGAGVQIKDVNLLIKQFSQMHKMMKKMKGGKMRKMMGALGGGGMGDMAGGLPGGGAGMPDLAGMDQKELAKLAKQFK